MRVPKTLEIRPLLGSLALAALIACLPFGSGACVKKQASQPCTQSEATPTGKRPPKTRPDCKVACDYFIYCQSPRWATATELKEDVKRCADQCEEAKAGTGPAKLFDGVKGCATNRPCIPFRDCMRKIVEKIQGPAPGQGPQEDPNAIYRVPIDGAPSQGAATAPVTIVMFADYECGFCGRGWNTLKQVQKAFGGKIRVVYKHFPLPFHKGGKKAAEMAHCVMTQKGLATFWKLHEDLYANPGDFSEKSLLAAAKKVGADPAKVKACMGDAKALAPLAKDMELGQALGVDGTPAFFINGKKLSGAQPLEEFSKAIGEALARAQAAQKAGVKPEDVYQHLTGKGHTKVQLLKGQAGGDHAGHGHGEPAGPPELDPEVVFQVPVTRNDPARGPADALVTIVEFADYQCPACGLAGEVLKPLLAAFPKDVRLVFRNNPLPNHPDAALAAEAALAVRAQKGDAGYFAYHDKLYANLKDLSRPVLEKLAKELGVDLARFKKALDSHTHKAQVDADAKFADRMGVPGTPAFFINGRVVMGLMRPEEFKKRIQDEIAKAKKALAKGVKRAGYYDHLMKNAKTTPVFKKK